MHQSHSKWKFFMGLMSVVLMLGAGANLAQAAKGPDHSDLTSDHANLAIDHDGLDQKLDQVLADISNIMVGAPCGEGTFGQRFVVSADGKEVCDNGTGRHWEQAPSQIDGRGLWSDAVAHCATLDFFPIRRHRKTKVLTKPLAVA